MNANTLLMPWWMWAGTVARWLAWPMRSRGVISFSAAGTTRPPIFARAGCAAALVVGLVGPAFAQQATSLPVFDWSLGGAGGDPHYTPAPVLTDANANSVIAFLQTRHNGNDKATLAIRIVSPISAATAHAVFSAFAVNYVFADFESSNALSQFSTLRSQITDHASKSANAFIGEFNLYPVTNDGTRPNPVVSGAPSFPSTPFTSNDYKNSGATMANPSAYPGSPDFVSKPTAQNPFPNLRSAFFVLPIDRVTFSTDFLTAKQYPVATPVRPGGFQNIPWVCRFENYGNDALNNAPGLQGYKYAFNTTGASNPYANQLPSAGDFQAQMLHYRLRGATSFNLFNYSVPGASGGSNLTNSSVIGYSPLQERTDAYDGFSAISGGPNKAPNTTLAAIWQRNNYAFANLNNNVPTAPNKSTSSIATGMVLSGEYDISGPTRQLALLLSNMSSKAESVDLWQKYGGESVDLNGKTAALDQTYVIQPGIHQLLQFDMSGGKWVLFQNVGVFADSNRNGIGVPEPTSLALLGLAGAGFLLRRPNRRRM